jgi:hypothetical protein
MTWNRGCILIFYFFFLLYLIYFACLSFLINIIFRGDIYIYIFLNKEYQKMDFNVKENWLLMRCGWICHTCGKEECQNLFTWLSSSVECKWSNYSKSALHHSVRSSYLYQIIADSWDKLLTKHQYFYLKSSLLPASTIIFPLIITLACLNEAIWLILQSHVSWVLFLLMSFVQLFA